MSRKSGIILICNGCYWQILDLTFLVVLIILGIDVWTKLNFARENNWINFTTWLINFTWQIFRQCLLSCCSSCFLTIYLLSPALMNFCSISGTWRKSELYRRHTTQRSKQFLITITQPVYRRKISSSSS